MINEVKSDAERLNNELIAIGHENSQIKQAYFKLEQENQDLKQKS
jgi:hypothetical protein